MRRLAVLATLAVVMTIGACGSDDDRLSSEEFLEQRNVICGISNATITEASAPFAGREPTSEELAAFIEDTMAPSVQDVIDDLGALNPPEDIQDTVDQLLADTQTALDEMVETAASDPAAMFTSNEETFADVNARATKLGLTACGGNAQSDG